ncbi:MAG TPA: TonB family protein [Granulicella sp.]|nr:TonB family protein [Granulicella sp.]
MPQNGPRLNDETDGSMWSSLLSNLRDAFGSDKSAPLQLESKPIESDLILEEEGVFSSLWSSVRDVFFPKKLPPLVLESRPIPVIDRMAVKRNPLSTAIAIGFYAIVIGLAWYFQSRIMKFVSPPKQFISTQIEAPPPIAPPKAIRMGGGGGQRGPAPVSKGSPPKFDPVQIVPPKAPPLEQPKIAVVPTIDVQKDVKMASNMPNIGMPNAPTVGVSMGNGNGSGLGSGNGNGMGPGSGGNYGGGVRQIGGAVLPPSWLHKVEPEFSEEARKAKIGGNVLVYMIVDANGRPRNIKVIRGLGMGLDEKAIEAMKESTFHPAMENGKPVPVELQVEVNFQIF